MSGRCLKPSSANRVCAETCEEYLMPNTIALVNQEIALADWTIAIKESALQHMLLVASRPEILSFALGLPAVELFPVESFARAMTKVLSTNPRALQYGPPPQQLKEQIVGLMAKRGIKCSREQIFLTAGAQQGMSLLTKLLLNFGGQILTEEMSYTGFHQVIEPFQPDVLTVPTDLETGISVDEIESLLEAGARPAFIYIVTDGQNPLGVNLSAANRIRLVEVARRYCVPIVEDDAYGFLYYGSQSLAPLRSLDENYVFYLGSFSKILAPALRTGWIVAPEALMKRLAIIKEASDINTSTLAQHAISAFLDAGHLDDHIARLRREYKGRRDTMLRALEKHFPADAKWSKPTSGVFIWVELAGYIDTNELFKMAIDTEKIAFIPGEAFCLNDRKRAKNGMRLNFSNCAPERIEDGIARLGACLREFTTTTLATEHKAIRL